MRLETEDNLESLTQAALKPPNGGGGGSGGGVGATGNEASISLRQASISRPDISQMKPFKPSTTSGK